MIKPATSHALFIEIASRIAVLTALLFAAICQAQSDYYLFESGHVRPMTLSPDGSRLFAVNTPDNRLEIFDIGTDGLVHSESVAVGMEPVTVAARSNDEVWVVNHLSDSVSIIDVSSSPAQLSQTLLVGDEPRDLVFAGTGNSRAFISTARRGQHRTDASIASVSGAGDPLLTTDGIGRADVWVFDTSSLATQTTVGGEPLAILSFFADTPRALARSADGNTVYVAAFKSGNQTTTINENSVCDGFQMSGGSNCGPGAPGGVPGPADNAAMVQAPETGLIVKFNGSIWADAVGRDWSSLVSFDLPDQDVFSFNANFTNPGNLNTASFSGVGTILFNMAVNPVTGKLYVTNTESPNHIRFEGAGDHGGSTVQGRLSETRITVIDPGLATVEPRHINQHIDYSKLHTANDAQTDNDIIAMRPHTLATPMQIVSSADGGTLYMAAFGSGKIGVFSSAAIEDASFASNFDPTTASSNYIHVAGGPSGLALDEPRNRLYVIQRFDHSIAEINLDNGNTLRTHSLADPEPASVVDGRPFLYDALFSSGNGESSCASCHIFGDMDDLAWNLGDPDAAVSATNNQPASVIGFPSPFHPMKGPMVTQTLRGMSTHGAMHWRGDRVDGFFGAGTCTPFPLPGCDEAFSFNNFIVAFEGLLGKDGIPAVPEMSQFTDFALQLVMPPNPVANLNGSLTGDQADGALAYNTVVSDLVATCAGCHTIDPANGFFGSSGFETFEGGPQNMKVAHLRNMYQKVGAFGTSVTGGPGGNQIRGFGYSHDGSVGSLEDFVGFFQLSNQQVDDIVQMMLAFPTDLAPVVGQQVTLRSDNGLVANPRIDLLRNRAQASFTSAILGGVTTECELVVKGSVGGEPRGWLMQAGGDYQDDTGAIITDVALRALPASDGPLTFTCVVPGTGQRMALDRDRDTVLDGNDNCDAIANAGQLNFDGDGQGDVCDNDDDNDLLTDQQELALGTDPLDTDSDDDGFSDNEEIFAGSNPLSALSTPETINIPSLPLLGYVILLLGLVGIWYAQRGAARL